YLPGIGPKTFEKLMMTLGTEMTILHQSSKNALRKELPEKLVQLIIAMRYGEIQIQAGGGGNYGRLLLEQDHIDLLSTSSMSFSSSNHYSQLANMFYFI